ncbi:hypothetical protein FN976_28455 [Caenimonas sedimenti]|uniref:Uncharacterized protein n=1 Tax=Caenimonas sedimenti TaxID=2596921 RepID=A0A562ZDQ2_9BURK|nr:hypothetical protein [Caenimonas sedimenti]TWO63636.1 hypothetical protein FN976_28455 [Caenimonas sedimenti]
MPKLEDKVQLQDGERLELVTHRSKGTLSETDIFEYAVVNAAGVKVGSVVHTDHTAIKGFQRTQTVEQRDAQGKMVVDAVW